nr:hypothetical protein [Tanacetum cinerariifolium]
MPLVKLFRRVRDHDKAQEIIFSLGLKEGSKRLPVYDSNKNWVDTEPIAIHDLSNIDYISRKVISSLSDRVLHLENERLNENLEERNREIAKLKSQIKVQTWVTNQTLVEKKTNMKTKTDEEKQKTDDEKPNTDMKVNATKHKLTTAGDETDGFEQVVDFLNANSIKYALTMSPTIYTSCIKEFRTSAKVKTINDDVRLQALVDGKKVIINEASIRRDLRLDAEGTACLPNDAIFEGLERMGHHPLNNRGSTNQEGNRRRQLRILSLEQTKTNQAAEIEKLKKRLKKLEGKKKKKRTHGLKRLYKVGLSARVESSKDKEGLTLMEIKAAKPKAKGVTIQKPSKFRTTSPPQPSQPPQDKDKCKGIVVEPEKPLKKKDQIALDEEVVRKLKDEMKAKIDEEERIAREKNEANRAIIKE